MPMKRMSAKFLATWGRIFTAVPLGYVATSLVVMALARLLPGGPMQASVAAGLLSFLIYAALKRAGRRQAPLPAIAGAAE